MAKVTISELSLKSAIIYVCVSGVIPQSSEAESELVNVQQGFFRFCSISQ